MHLFYCFSYLKIFHNLCRIRKNPSIITLFLYDVVYVCRQTTKFRRTYYPHLRILCNFFFVLTKIWILKLPSKWSKNFIIAVPMPLYFLLFYFLFPCLLYLIYSFISTPAKFPSFLIFICPPLLCFFFFPPSNFLSPLLFLRPYSRTQAQTASLFQVYRSLAIRYTPAQ